MSSKRLESGKDNARINALVEKLRIKLKNFAVLDRQGELIGEVNDLILDTNRQLNLVVSQAATEKSSRLFLLMSKLIQKIDPPNKSVLVDINKAEMDNLPEYSTTETPGMELSEMPNTSAEPPHEAADEGTTQNSDVYPTLQETLEGTNLTEYADISPVPASAIQTPDSELQNNQDELDDITLKSLETPKVLEEEIIRLLGERLIVDRSKRKVGEVIVRKEIETRMVQVPVRREKLIVEQVSPERKQLAEIDLGQEEIPGIELLESAISETEIASIDSGLTVSGEFNSPKIASLLLNAIALERRQGCKKVRVQIVVEDAERQKTYQEWFDRSSGSQQDQSGKRGA